MKRKSRTSSDTRRLSKKYADELRLRAQLLRTAFLLTKVAREAIARDLEELAYIAEKRPQCFRKRA